MLGFLLGCLFFVLSRFAIAPCFQWLDHTIPTSIVSVDDGAAMMPSSTTDENLVLVGIMSAKQFLVSRVVPSFDTWTSTIPGKVSFVLCTVHV